MMNKSSMTMAILFLTLLAGCGGEMRSAQKAKSLSSSESTSLGKLDWDDVKINNDNVELVYDLQIPFGRVYKTVSKVMDLMTPRLCESMNSTGQNYRAGEVPCGRIIDNNWKELTVVNIERSESVNSGYNVTVDAFNVPVWLSRTTRQGNYVERDLDVRRDVQKTSSAQFAKDLSLKWTPSNNAVKMEMCMNIPGGTLTAPKFNVNARARKKTWYGHFSTSSGFEVTPGSATWEFGRGCFEVNYIHAQGMEDSQLVLKTTKAPYLSGVQYKGLNIRIKDWFWRLVDNIMSIFNASIRKSIIKKFSNSVNNMADRDVESGQWFSKVYSDEVLRKQGDKLHSRIRQVIQRTGGLMNGGNVKSLLRDNCRLIKFSKHPLWDQKHQAFCTSILQNLEISVDPLHRDEESQQAGCYDSFANIHATKTASGEDKWWSKKCKFSARFTIRMSQSAKDYLDEIHDLLLQQIDEARIPADWKNILDSFQIDEMALNLVLEEAEKKGLEALSAEDLRKQLPSLIEQVKQKL
jgi:hypothetical protein